MNYAANTRFAGAWEIVGATAIVQRNSRECRSRSSNRIEFMTYEGWTLAPAHLGMIIRAKLTPEPGSRNKRRHWRADGGRFASYQKIVPSYPGKDGAIVLGLEIFFGSIVPKRFT
jgi:hypothetical protein